MNGFENLWERTLEQVGVEKEIVDLLRRLNFSGRLALLATDPQGNRSSVGNLQEEIVRQAREKDAIKVVGLTEDALRLILSKIFVEQIRPRSVIREDIAEVIVEVAVQTVARRQGLLPVQPQIVGGILALLNSGDFFRFPGPFAMLAHLGDWDEEPAGELLLDIIAQQATLEPQLAGISGDRIREILSILLLRREDLPGITENEDILEAIIRIATNETAGRLGVPVEPNDARAALKLLMTGEFFGDAVQATTAVLRTVPKIPLAVPLDVVRFPRRIVDLFKAIVTDVAGAPLEVVGFVRNRLDANVPDREPQILVQTLTWVYGNGTLKNIVDLLRELTAPDNETVRLALVLYARANGIPITQGHLDALRDSVFNPQSPNLGPALKYGVDVLLKRNGEGKTKELLRRFISNL
jgi:hypothetical protein